MLGLTDHQVPTKLERVHMNGRVYDPALGRFLSVDPVYQFPTNMQSLNPYSYVMNNPLSLTDPSGYEAGGGTAPCGGSDKCPDKSIAGTVGTTGSHVAAGRAGATDQKIAALGRATGVNFSQITSAQAQSDGSLKVTGGKNGEENSQQNPNSALNTSQPQAGGQAHNAPKGTPATGADGSDSAVTGFVKGFIDDIAQSAWSGNSLDDLTGTKQVSIFGNSNSNSGRFGYDLAPAGMILGSLVDPAAAEQTVDKELVQLYHRLGDSPEVIEAIRDSGKLMGEAPRNFYQSDIPQVKAYIGPLPAGAKGFEFTTPVLPSTGTAPGKARWLYGSPGVELQGDKASISCSVVRVSC